MQNLHALLTTTARYLYCTQVPESWHFEGLNPMERLVHAVNFGFDLLDLVNTIVDIVFLVNLYQYSSFQGTMLLIGMLLARLSTRQGERFPVFLFFHSHEPVCVSSCPCLCLSFSIKSGNEQHSLKNPRSTARTGRRKRETKHTERRQWRCQLQPIPTRMDT